MGKNLTQQKRGKGSPRYRAPSFRYAGKVALPDHTDKLVEGKVIDILHSQGHSAALIKVEYENNKTILLQAPEGIRVNDILQIGEDIEVKEGNIMKLKDMPEGTLIYNIESKPGDGGKFCRASGMAARIITKLKDRVIVQLPSAKERNFFPECRAMIGIVAGSGRKEKPYVKAGTKFYAMKAKNKVWPVVSGTSMNAVAHPFGSKGSHTKGRPTQASRHSPPGRKVGKIAPRRTGRRKK